MSTRRGKRRPTPSTSPTTPPQSASPLYRIVINLIGDGDERVLADHTVEGYVLALGRSLPNEQFEHNTLRGGPLELSLNLASVIPDAMAEFIAKHLDQR
jgi:hypothetical protein